MARLAAETRDAPSPQPLDVFINCPFDAAFRPLFHALVFTVMRAGFRARCALETEDSSQVRLQKIVAIIEGCRFAIHDLSRTETSGDPALPRFNMPFELGLFMGAKYYGGRRQGRKVCLILDREPYRYQRFISDLAGQDIRAHGGQVSAVIRETTTWLRNQAEGKLIPGSDRVLMEFLAFEAELPAILRALDLSADDLTFVDLTRILGSYFKRTIAPPLPPGG